MEATSSSDELQQESLDKVGKLEFSPPPMTKCDTRDSISSMDSDLAADFTDDRRGSRGEEADLSDNNSSDCEKKSDCADDSDDKRLKKQNSSDHDSGLDSFDDNNVLDNTRKSDSKTSASEHHQGKPSADSDDFFVPPSDELAEKICAQVEFYFSDENIVKDAFLLKHVRRNKEGYVSLKLISSFKRVKHLSRDWRVVGAALAKSTKLEVNEQGTKLRRKDALPRYDQTAPSRTILAARLPLEKLTVESVAEIFRPCGEIALIRILRPGNPAPAEVRQAIAKRPELASSEECALVEFTDSASARAAMELSLGDARIYELQQTSEKKRKQQVTKKSSTSKPSKEENYNSSSCQSSSEPEDYRTRYGRVHGAGHPHQMYHVYPGHPFPAAGPPSPEAWLSRRLSSCSITSPEPPSNYVLRRMSSSSSSSDNSFGRRFSSCSSSSEGGFYHPIYHHSPGYYSPPNRRFSCCSTTGTALECSGGCYSPSRRGSADYGPFLRRMSACSRDSGVEAGGRRLSTCSSGSEGGFYRPRSNSGFVAATHLPDNVTRLPAGPDGTRGFGRPNRLSSIEPAC